MKEQDFWKWYSLGRDHNIQKELSALVRTAGWTDDSRLPMRQLRVERNRIDSLRGIRVQRADVAAQLCRTQIIDATLQWCLQRHLNEARLTEAGRHQGAVQLERRNHLVIKALNNFVMH